MAKQCSTSISSHSYSWKTCTFTQRRVLLEEGRLYHWLTVTEPKPQTSLLLVLISVYSHLEYDRATKLAFLYRPRRISSQLELTFSKFDIFLSKMIDPNNTPPHYYRALTQPRAFRLMHLLPGNGQQDLCCELKDSHLDTPPTFEALSYVWGDAKKRINMLCNEKLSDIGESLSTALQTLRYTDRTRILWIDALCINQKDPAEKSLQVPLMGDIYRSAKRVVAWVGQEAEKDSSALDVGKYVHLPSLEGEQQLSPRELATWIALPSFIQRPWFSRVWIVQELALARTLTLYCGKKQLEWSVLREGIEAFLRRIGIHLNTSSTDVSLERIFTLIGIRSLVTEHTEYPPTRSRKLVEYGINDIREDRETNYIGPGDLLQFVQATRLFGATDPRDRIYAMFGLALPSDWDRIQLSYENSYSFAQLYQNFARTMIQQSGALNILSQAGLHETMPSWAADWSRPSKTHPLKLSAYNASRASIAHTASLQFHKYQMHC